jgi:aryl-alcohol dehydrogenase-like predicted oxidoreductase
MAALRDRGLTDLIGVAPGPANGFTLDLIDCFDRFCEVIDWAMIILNPFEPWPGELCLEAARAGDVRLITRVVDYGGLLWDDVLPGHRFPPGDHRAFRPAGWVEAGREKLERLRPIGAEHDLTPIQLACDWNLAHAGVECVVPTLIQEPGPEARPIEDKREELRAVPAEQRLGREEVDRIRAIGDNAGCMALKGASPAHVGDERPDRWPLSDRLERAGRRFGIEPGRDLAETAARG